MMTISVCMFVDVCVFACVLACSYVCMCAHVCAIVCLLRPTYSVLTRRPMTPEPRECVRVSCASLLHKLFCQLH